ALKPLPAISPTADRCMECGFCEPRCPSRLLTVSPRQRIVITREMTRLAALGTPEAMAVRDALAADFEYEGVETCAGDSMCRTSCPVKIDTGALMKEMKGARRSSASGRLALLAARRFGAVAAMARLSLGAASRLRSLPGGARALDLLTTPLHRAAPMLVPRLRPDMELPAPAWPLPAAAEPPRVEAEGSPRRVVYFPSCLTRILGPLPGEAAVPLARAILDVLQAGGFAVVLPPAIGSLCCGMPFASKAFSEAPREASARAAEALWTASRQGADPVVTDASPCAGTLQELAASHLPATGRRLRALDFP